MDHGLDPERLSRVARALTAGPSDANGSLCSTAARLVGVAGAGVVLMSAGRPLGMVCTSDPTTEIVEEAQFTLGEGPCVDAVRTRAPTIVSDLAALDEVRWPSFRPDALAAGIRAAFGFPLVVGRACIGALDLYEDKTGPLTDEQFSEAVAVAHVAARVVLSWQTVAEPESLAWQLEQVPTHRAAVHQATGMVSVQAGVPIGDAMALLQAHAFADGRSISAVAADVVARHLRFD
jgi:transcriptional regulator with GAF, ATPase, and Fis domain